MEYQPQPPSPNYPNMEYQQPQQQMDYQMQPPPMQYAPQIGAPMVTQRSRPRPDLMSQHAGSVPNSGFAAPPTNNYNPDPQQPDIYPPVNHIQPSEGSEALARFQNVPPQMQQQPPMPQQQPPLQQYYPPPPPPQQYQPPAPQPQYPQPPPPMQYPQPPPSPPPQYPPSPPPPSGVTDIGQIPEENKNLVQLTPTPKVMELSQNRPYYLANFKITCTEPFTAAIASQQQLDTNQLDYRNFTGFAQAQVSNLSGKPEPRFLVLKADKPTNATVTVDYAPPEHVQTAVAKAQMAAHQQKLAPVAPAAQVPATTEPKKETDKAKYYQLGVLAVLLGLAIAWWYKNRKPGQSLSEAFSAGKDTI